MRFEDWEKQKAKQGKLGPVALALVYTFVYLLAAAVLVYFSYRYNWFGVWK
jgi:hypothetical protein